MSIPKLTNDLNIIQKLSDLPNSTEGMAADQLKAKFDEAGLEIQNWINETLIPAITAGNIPFPKNAEVDADTVEAAILAVQKQIVDAASGAIVDGSVTKAKLTTALLERVYGGRCWVALDTPGSADNPGNDLPVGQIWLRPAFYVANKNGNNWTVTACSADTDGNNVTMTGSQLTNTAAMTQTLYSVAKAGDRIYVLFDVGDLDNEITSFTVSINGTNKGNAKNGGVFMQEASGTSVSVAFYAEWPSTSLAKGKAEVKNLAIINVDEILRGMESVRDMKNWATFLKAQMPITNLHLPDALYIQKDSGEWWPIGFDVLPAERGGTGLTEIGDGEMLYGKDGGYAKLEKPADGSFLQFSGGNPAWAAMDTLGEHGFARITTGTYTGNEEARTITLPITPKLLVIHDDKYVAVLQDGTKQEQSLSASYTDSMTSGTYTAGIRLNGNNLETYMKGYEAFQNPKPKAWNQSGTTHHWVAIY